MRVASKSCLRRFLSFTCLRHDINAWCSTASAAQGPRHLCKDPVIIDGKQYEPSDQCNLTARILEQTTRKLHLKECHPLYLVKRRITDFFEEKYTNRRGNPAFSVYDRLSPVVTLEQNFDSLLVPASHPSRCKSDSYYINNELMLRAHTSAHQRDLVKAGLDAFLVAGDVYRRDEIDRHHYPIFHQIEGVRLFSADELFPGRNHGLSLFESGNRESDKQGLHTREAAKLLEHSLKTCLQGLAQQLLGPETEIRWVSTYFPFTHPSWELEAKFQGDWLELLGCGIMEQEILFNAGVEHKVGWAFGVGLERLAMALYSIPDIRAFWSTDPAFLAQFEHNDPYQPVVFRELSCHPPCLADMSFWAPPEFSANDFFDIVRSCGGDLVERVEHRDTFIHPKTHRTSHCYRIVYRHVERVLVQAEANAIHKQIGAKAEELLGVELRIK
ncbi:hypothetical protein HPB49_005194 [Dermacentor silvarum]|uniref:Uncharacterized protein n=1 Tax=Dermacentor silvarum TaxID=543639 RepID=A0ACB8DVG2_DERSI|nr:phenylalanine--tRNA ligase, mitochondrial [Dermacentor silvarum]KAH7978324.1 hypothetical protein HPB49_005194 [Dermacentor silvarum]